MYCLVIAAAMIYLYEKTIAIRITGILVDQRCSTVCLTDVRDICLVWRPYT